MKKEVEQNIELATLFMMLEDHGATHILVTFSGGGDEGVCDYAHALLPKHVDENNAIGFDAWSADSELEADGMPNIQPNLSALSELVTSYLHDHDWWNNDGGQGSIVFSLLDYSYNVEYSICGEDLAEYEVDEDGDVDYDSAESNHEYDNYSSAGTLKLV
jgi:hypothetical protein